MKKIITSVLIVMFSAVAVASFAAEPKDSPYHGKSIQGFVTNRFGDNWELSVNAGPAYTAVGRAFGETDPKPWAKRIGWEVNIAANKWFHPVFGVRAQLQLGEMTNFSFANGDKTKWMDVVAHVDGLLNLSNWIGNYREDRVYYAILFAGGGLQVSTPKHPNYGFMADAGLINRFRVCKCLDINLELKGWLYRENDLPAEIVSSGAFATSYSVTAGLTYRFNKRNWDRAIAPETLDAYMKAAEDAQAAADALANENDALKGDLKDAQDTADALNKDLDNANDEIERLKGALNDAEKIGNNNRLWFEIGSAQLSRANKTALRVVAKEMNNTDRNYTVVGYADPDTGSAAWNQTLSEKRAEAVRNYLISQGVEANRLTAEGRGDSSSPYHEAMANRVVVIE